MGYNEVMDKAQSEATKDKKIKAYLWIPIVLVGVLVSLIIFIISVRIFTPEDTWLCKDGLWVKHGQPSAPQPTLECRKTEGSNTDNPIVESKPISNPGFFDNLNLVGSAHEGVNNIPDQNPIGPVQISGFFRFMSPAIDVMADFGSKVCQWGRPKEIADTCPSVKLNFQNFFNGVSR
jgi:hypothetical protein